MADTAEQDVKQAEQAAPAGDQVRLMMNQSDLKVAYANAFQSHHLKDELILDLGVQLPVQDPQTGGQAISFDVSQRVIMNYATARRLVEVVSQALNEHEARMKQAIESLQSGGK